MLFEIKKENTDYWQARVSAARRASKIYISKLNVNRKELRWCLKNLKRSQIKNKK